LDFNDFELLQTFLNATNFFKYVSSLKNVVKGMLWLIRDGAHHPSSTKASMELYVNKIYKSKLSFCCSMKVKRCFKSIASRLAIEIKSFRKSLPTA
jgi:hypothetical protein